tara:strand:+ start:275 stop:589 length:315 start_codon:yes stop_codon:yes gene_type:complete
MGTSKKMTAAERRVIDLIKSRPGIEFHQGGRWTKKTHVDIFDDDDGLFAGRTKVSVMDRLAARGIVANYQTECGEVLWDASEARPCHQIAAAIAHNPAGYVAPV